MNSLFLKALFAAAVFSCAWPANAQTEAEAKKLLERISGTKVPADDPRLQQMIAAASAGDWAGAAAIATSDPNFLNVTVKQMAQKMSTREESIQTQFNDFSAFLMGVVRDETDARKLLTGDFYYRADPDKIPAGVNIRSDLQLDFVQNNNHYADLDKVGLDIGGLLKKENGQMLLQTSTNTMVYNPDPAGLLTTRAFMGSHAVAGTNRRPVEYTFRELMCVGIDEWADTTQSDSRIGRDIDRFPGGDHTKFQVSCKGCHTVMDGFRGAFAKWNADQGRIINFDAMNEANYGGFSNGVAGKMNGNSNVFPGGFVTKDSSWVNNARGPANEPLFGWRGMADQGFGVKALGEAVSNSARFSQCMVKRSFEAVCRRELNIKDFKNFVHDQAARFESGGYNLKKLFQSVALSKECVQ
jgi:hypothetical protein